MLIHAKKLINMRIIESMSSRKLGFISDIIVNPANGLVLALKLKKSFLFGKNQILMFQDVIEIYLDGLTTLSERNIIEPSEVLRVKEVIDKNIFLLGSDVVTQNDKKLGILEDFIFDTNFLSIITLVIKKHFSSERRIVSAERILNILPNKIVIRDMNGKVKVSNKAKILEPILPF